MDTERAAPADEASQRESMLARESLLARGVAALFVIALVVATISSLVGGDGPYG